MPWCLSNLLLRPPTPISSELSVMRAMFITHVRNSFVLVCAGTRDSIPTTCSIVFKNSRLAYAMWKNSWILSLYIWKSWLGQLLRPPRRVQMVLMLLKIDLMFQSRSKVSCDRLHVSQTRRWLKFLGKTDVCTTNDERNGIKRKTPFGNGLLLQPFCSTDNCFFWQKHYPDHII